MTGRAARLSPEVRTLAGLAFLVAVGYGLVAPVLPLFARSFDVGVTAAAALISAFAVVRVVAAPLSGRVVARWGELPVLCTGLLIVAASSAACAAAADFAQLFAFRVLGGVGSTFFTVSSDLILIGVSDPAVLGRASSAWSGAFLVGGIAGPVLGAALVPWGLRAPFLVYGALLLVATSVAAARLRGRNRAAGGREASAAIPFRDAWRERSFRGALAGNFTEGWTDGGVRLLLVPVAVGASWSGAALAAFAAGTAVGLPLGGWLADHRGRRLPAMLGSATLAVTALGLAVSGTVPELLAAAGVSGLGSGLVTPAANAAVGDVLSGGETGGSAGSAVAGFQMTGDLGVVLGPLGAGVAADVGGNVTAFGVAAVVAGVSFLVWLQVPGRHGR